MMSPGAQNFARIRPRITEPASFPAPIKPNAYLFKLTVLMRVILSGAKNLPFIGGSH
jgi:hypothetical protein